MAGRKGLMRIDPRSKRLHGYGRIGFLERLEDGSYEFGTADFAGESHGLEGGV
jgi:hypothetical protein